MSPTGDGTTNRVIRLPLARRGDGTRGGHDGLWTSSQTARARATPTNASPRPNRCPCLSVPCCAAATSTTPPLASGGKRGGCAASRALLPTAGRIARHQGGPIGTSTRRATATGPGRPFGDSRGSLRGRTEHPPAFAVGSVKQSAPFPAVSSRAQPRGLVGSGSPSDPPRAPRGDVRSLGSARYEHRRNDRTTARSHDRGGRHLSRPSAFERKASWQPVFRVATIPSHREVSSTSLSP